MLEKIKILMKQQPECKTENKIRKLTDMLEKIKI